MKKSEYQQMAEHEKTYWWHVGRLKIIEQQLSKISQGRKLRILNIGCGTGGTVALLEKFGEVTNLDISSEALKFLAEKGFKGKIYDGTNIPYKDSTFDLVVSLDVLEHIENDQESLFEWQRVLKPGGNLLITVPAYSWLWSGHDTSLHHWRRYTTSRLAWDVNKAHMKTLKLSYAISFSIPLVAGFRLIHKLFNKRLTEASSYVKVPAIINGIFIRLLVIESYFLKRFRLFAGTTVLGIFAK